MPSCFLYRTFSLDFLKSSLVTFMRRSRSAMRPASVQMAWRRNEETGEEKCQTCLVMFVFLWLLFFLGNKDVKQNAET